MSGHGKTLELQEIKVPLPKEFHTAVEYVKPKEKVPVKGNEIFDVDQSAKTVRRHLSGSYNVGRNKFKRETRKPYGMSKKVWNERRRQVNR